jgi:hypothetical protein
VVKATETLKALKPSAMLPLKVSSPAKPDSSPASPTSSAQPEAPTPAIATIVEPVSPGIAPIANPVSPGIAPIAEVVTPAIAPIAEPATPAIAPIAEPATPAIATIAEPVTPAIATIAVAEASAAPVSDAPSTAAAPTVTETPAPVVADSAVVAPVAPVVSVAASFRLPLGAVGTTSTTKVEVAGAWNGWSDRLTLSLNADSTAFEGSLPLGTRVICDPSAPPPTQNFKFILDDSNWVIDPAQTVVKNEAGVDEHSVQWTYS